MLCQQQKDNQLAYLGRNVIRRAAKRFRRVAASDSFLAHTEVCDLQ